MVAPFYSLVAVAGIEPALVRVMSPARLPYRPTASVLFDHLDEHLNNCLVIAFLLARLDHSTMKFFQVSGTRLSNGSTKMCCHLVHRSAGQQRHRYWLLKYLEARQNIPLPALVLDSGAKRTFLLLTDILLNIDMPTPGQNRPEPGSTVTVKVIRVNALDNMLRFEW